MFRQDNLGTKKSLPKNNIRLCKHYNSRNWQQKTVQDYTLGNMEQKSQKMFLRDSRDK
jgi:hypothetical protein